jgi:hypothetical protein
MLLREHRFTFFAGTEVHLFRIEELVRGMTVWPHRFRLRLPSSSGSEVKTIYGASCYEVAQKAADLIASNSGWSGVPGVTHLSAGPQVSPPQALQILQQEFD